MSFLGDTFGFEKFNLGDMWKKIKKHPEQLFLGAADPYGAKLWSGITGKNYEPLVDQMGGAYGGHVLSMGPGGQDGGVYKRAREAGINTDSGAGMQDLAHMVSAMYAGNYGMGKLPQFPGGQGHGLPGMGGQSQQSPQDDGRLRAMIAALRNPTPSADIMGQDEYQG